jgi:hypothetical protein
MKNYYRITVKCPDCGRIETRRIDELLAGSQCFPAGPLFGRPRCTGIQEYHSEDPTQAVSNALQLLGYLQWTTFSKDASPLAVLVDTVNEDVQCWTEGEQTPQQMGWVGSNGLP